MVYYLFMHATKFRQLISSVPKAECVEILKALLFDVEEYMFRLATTS